MKWINADSAITAVKANSHRGKIDSDWLLLWIANNQKSGTFTPDPPPPPPPPPGVYIEPYPSRKLGVAGIPAVVKVIQTTFITPADVLAALAIAVAESSLETAGRNWHPEYGNRAAGETLAPGAPSPCPQSDRGLWQISSHWWPQYTDLQCDTPTLAISAVRYIRDNGGGWDAWDTYKGGAAQKHYDAAVDGWPALRPLVPGA